MPLLTFNGRNNEDADFDIESVMRLDRPLAPSHRAIVKQITGRAGAYFFKKVRNPKIIPIRIAIKSQSVEAKQTAIRNISDWLDTEEPQELIFGDEPEKRDMAILIDEVIPDHRSPFFAYIDILMINYDSYSEGTATKSASPNSGNLKTPVKLTATINTDTSSLKITLNQTGEFLQIDMSLLEEDEVVFDNGSHSVEISEIDIRNKLTVESVWFMLPKGIFSFSVEPADTTLEIEFRERWK